MTDPNYAITLHAFHPGSSLQEVGWIDDFPWGRKHVNYNPDYQYRFLGVFYTNRDAGLITLDEFRDYYNRKRTIVRRIK